MINLLLNNPRLQKSLKIIQHQQARQSINGFWPTQQEETSGLSSQEHIQNVLQLLLRLLLTQSSQKHTLNLASLWLLLLQGVAKWALPSESSETAPVVEVTPRRTTFIEGPPNVGQKLFLLSLTSKLSNMVTLKISPVVRSSWQKGENVFSPLAQTNESTQS